MTNTESMLTRDELVQIKMEHVKEESVTRDDIKAYVDAVRDAQDAKTARSFEARIEALIDAIEKVLRGYPEMPDEYNDDKLSGWLECEREVKKALRPFKAIINKEEHNGQTDNQ